MSSTKAHKNILDSNAPILVINATGRPFALPDNRNAQIQITGVVRRFAIANIEREYNLRLQPEYYAGYENQPVIITRSLGLSPRPGDITRNPEPYYGQVVTVTGEVEDVRTLITFTLKENQFFGNEDLLVLRGTATVPVKPGDTVAVTGVVRSFVVSDLERDLDITWDLNLQRNLEVEYSNKPVLVVTKVSPVTPQRWN